MVNTIEPALVGSIDTFTWMSSSITRWMAPDNKMGDSRQTGIQAPENLELGLAVADRLDNSGGSAVRSSGFRLLVSCLGL